MENETFLLLKMHECAEGVDDDALREIADRAELERHGPDDVIHRAEEVVTDVYLIVQGRIRFEALDVQGRTLMERVYSRGQQFGGIGAALGEPSPVLVTSYGPSWIFRHLPGGDQWFLLYLYRTGRFEPLLRKYLEELHLEQLPMPTRSITVDLVSGRPVVRTSGDAVHAILESINLPVMSLPICRGGQALVDGGLIDNVPANVLVDEGCNFVIAVSVTAKLESRFGKNEPDTPTKQMKAPSTLAT